MVDGVVIFFVILDLLVIYNIDCKMEEEKKEKEEKKEEVKVAAKRNFVGPRPIRIV